MRIVFPAKGARTTAIDPTTGDAMQLFHPRLHVWSDHFIAEVSGEILGVTTIGRVTRVLVAASLAHA